MSNIYRIVSIDPGTVTLGIAVIDLNVDDFSVTVTEAFTLNMTKAFKHREELAELFGSRTLRLQLMSDLILKELQFWEPNNIIAESSYLGRMVTSFESLVECRGIIRDACKRYDDAIPLSLIDPMSVKYGIGAVVRGERTKRRRKGKAKIDTKLAVRNKLKSLIDLLWAPGLPCIDYLDEHSVDAISIGYWRAQQMIGYLQYDDQNYRDFKKSLQGG